MLRIVSGRMGGGKSYYCVAEMLARARCEPNRYICTNFDLTDEGRERIGRHRLVELDHQQAKCWWQHTPQGASIYVDEAQVNFDSRGWNETRKAHPEFASYLSHIRKYGDSVVLCTQEFKHIDTRLRELAGQFTYTVSLKAAMNALKLWPEGVPELFLVRHFLDENRVYSAGWKLAAFSMNVGKCYDSYAVSTADGVERVQLTKLDGEVELPRASWGYAGWGLAACAAGASAAWMW